MPEVTTRFSGAPRLVIAYVVWGLSVISPVVVLIALSQRSIRDDDFKLFGALALLGVITTVACWLICRRVVGVPAVFIGAVVGAGMMVLAGFLSTKVPVGFEMSASLFVSSLALSIPSAVGSGIGGWLLRKQ